MARLPTREDDIRGLAQSAIAGLTANPLVFPAPPVTAVDLQAKLDSFNTAVETATAAKAAAEEATAVKKGQQDEVTVRELRWTEESRQYCVARWVGAQGLGASPGLHSSVAVSTEVLTKSRDAGKQQEYYATVADIARRGARSITAAAVIPSSSCAC